MPNQLTPVIRKVLISPTLANEMLKSNTRNRRLRPPVILRYVQEMKENRWKENTGEMIKISKSNEILDGQHRLHAIVKANVSLNLHVITGLEDDVFDVLDTGSLRNAADVFHISNVSHSNYLPSIIQTYEAINREKKNSESLNASQRITHTMLLNLYYERELFWSATAVKTVRWYKGFHRILPPSVIGGMYAVFHDRNTAQAEEFMNQLCMGYNLSNKTIGVLRAKLISDKVSKLKMEINYKNAIILKTWNLFRKNAEAKILKFDSSVEKFPTAI